MLIPLEAVTDAMRKLGISLDEDNGDGAQTMPADYRWRVGPEETSPRSAPEA